MTDDQPLDLDAVAADDAALDALRAGAGDDDALVLLRELLLDVERDLPRVPVGHGSTVLRLAAPPPARRFVRGGALVATLAAGTVSLGGVAAASTLAPVGSPLHDLGEAVRSAAGAVVGAVSPPDAPARPAVAVPTPTAAPSAAGTATTAVAPVAPRPAAPGAEVSAASRSRAAARQVDRLLDDAARLLRTGRTTAATGRLDLAERALADVLPADRADLPQRLAELRAQAASTAPKAKPGPKQDPPGGKAKSKEKGSHAPGRQPEEAPKKQRKKPSGKAQKEDGPKGGSLLAQSSSDASMNPRA